MVVRAKLETDIVPLAGEKVPGRPAAAGAVVVSARAADPAVETLKPVPISRGGRTCVKVSVAAAFGLSALSVWLVLLGVISLDEGAALLAVAALLAWPILRAARHGSP